MLTLLASPFNLQLGDSVSAKVVNYNAVGDSLESSVGNGAVMFISVVPDAPITLTKVEESTSRL
jgi:hypothetical protein